MKLVGHHTIAYRPLPRDLAHEAVHLVFSIEEANQFYDGLPFYPLILALDTEKMRMGFCKTLMEAYKFYDGPVL